MAVVLVSMAMVVMVFMLRSAMVGLLVFVEAVVMIILVT